ncbi:hypothetical protein A2291_01545 [candidate division WOR-1 bacterium RIFOXYB2_FULL_42_35]|uniref:Uncharacterized protein n=1 Tax=candidate division WOR-1 bacterium RIFOXYC2_FULL_41_25 TaxID=1802586 RepID=A0A1F4TQ93_UNCSA|nr:MAG: hypothetical protein A2247_03345 [candidate division WOR-1 bacterium RIFOXYA2_FULL_41_14]OGC25430.1 MAG: hypothetical protein A2291_01545 [candidate division WOR-1 bacterium RIFOXYB2_FULL_42_35]OGC34836.1 MAG: hypothetical protein A2462_05480 [candidate division WOR-1 bacterium RIFOXYC2_FULL_41_25]OGC42669.1 MAG: hypothetical protein A2548_07715 [candidate division WOR-1 bacterium RIFOXYD2_FULL_41_8]
MVSVRAPRLVTQRVVGSYLVSVGGKGKNGAGKAVQVEVVAGSRPGRFDAPKFAALNAVFQKPAQA